jgi:hypothetical protein
VIDHVQAWLCAAAAEAVQKLRYLLFDEFGIDGDQSWTLPLKKVAELLQEKSADTVKKTVPGAAGNKSKHRDYDQEMRAQVAKDSDAHGLSARQWAKLLECSTSTVHAQPAWREFKDKRESQREERQKHLRNNQGRLY